MTVSKLLRAHPWQCLNYCGHTHDSVKITVGTPMTVLKLLWAHPWQCPNCCGHTHDSVQTTVGTPMTMSELCDMTVSTVGTPMTVSKLLWAHPWVQSPEAVKPQHTMKVLGAPERAHTIVAGVGSPLIQRLFTVSSLAHYCHEQDCWGWSKMFLVVRVPCFRITFSYGELVTWHNSSIEIPTVVVVGTTALACATVCTAVGKPPGPRQGLWSLTVSAAPWTQTGVVVLDCQCNPLDPGRSCGPWLSVQPPGPRQELWSLTVSATPWTQTGVLVIDCQCNLLDPDRGSGLWLSVQPPGPRQWFWSLSVQPPGPRQGFWSLTVSTTPWTQTGVLVFDCECTPLGPDRGSGLWLSVQPPGPRQRFWSLTVSAAPWTQTGVLALDCHWNLWDCLL